MDMDAYCWVVQKNRQYLVAINSIRNTPMYSQHIYDAAQIKNANDARFIANKVGGNIHKFNPLTGEVV